MQRKISGLLAAILLFVAILGDVDTAFWADSVDLEGGRSYETAASVSIGKDYSNKSSTAINATQKAEENYYKFTIEQKGFVTVNFWAIGISIDTKKTSILPTLRPGNGSDESETSTDITTLGTLYFNPAENKNNALLTNSYWYALTPGSEASPKKVTVGLNPGTYYIQVNWKNNLIPYHFRIDFEADELCEVEKNDNIGSAYQIDFGKKYNAYCYAAVEKDTDYYQLSPSEDGYVVVSMAGKSSASIYSMNIYAADASTKSLSLSTISSKDVGASSVKIGVQKDKKYYVSVVGAKSAANNEAEEGNPYSIQADFTAAGDFEKEYNDSFEAANILQSNTPLNGIISTATDEDYYSFTPAENGVLVAEFSHDAIAGSETVSTYTIQVYNSDKTLLYEEKDMKGAQTRFTSSEIPVNKGATYYILVKGNGKCLTSYYKLSATYNASEAWEKEPNDTYDKATPIKSGKTYYGNTTTENDIDYYTIDAKKGYIVVSLKQDCGKAKNIYTLVISNADNKAIYTTKIKGSEKNYSMAKLGIKAGKYYICIKKGDSSYNGKYELTVTAKKASNWEVESNDDFSTANYIKIDKAVYGSTMGDATGSNSNDPYDFYKFTVKKGTYVNVNIMHDKIDDSERMWYACIYNTKGRVVGGSGVAVAEANVYSESKIVFLNKGTYYVRVGSSDPGVGHDYKLTVSKIAKKAPKITNITVKKTKKSKNLKISWNPVPGADKYEIYRSSTKNGKYSKLATIYEVGTLSYTDKSVKKGKTYYYKMKSIFDGKSTKLSKAKGKKVK